MKMKLDEYRVLRRNLRNLKDLDRFQYPRAVLHSILLQKKVEYVKRYYYCFLSRVDEIVKFWRNERRFPGWLKLPKSMKLRLLLKGLGFSKSEIKKSLEDPRRLEDDLRIYAWKALTEDYVYSPIAVKFQKARGKFFERLLLDFVESLNVEYRTENELVGKTPDVLFDEPVKVFNREVSWLESKAFFADLSLHRHYDLKQYSHYRKIYGEGSVVYWLGCLEEIDALTYSEFGLNRSFLNMQFIVCHEDGDPLKQIEEIVKFYSEGRTFVRCSKTAVRILRNMGFVCQTEISNTSESSATSFSNST